MSGMNQGTSAKVCLKMLMASIFITTFLCPPGGDFGGDPRQRLFLLNIAHLQTIYNNTQVRRLIP